MVRAPYLIGLAGILALAVSAYAPRDPAAEVQGYKGWTKTNPEPVRMSDVVSVLCRPPGRALATSMDAKSPHKKYFSTVYVNGKGASEFMKQKNPKFAAGTLIVKEKLPGEKAKAPELLTAMLKREKGYDPKHGDWEYMVLDGAAKQIQARGKLKSCQSCHDGQKDAGYVFRTYLPVQVAMNLK